MRLSIPPCGGVWRKVWRGILQRVDAYADFVFEGVDFVA